MSDEQRARRSLAALPGFTEERAGAARLSRLGGLTNLVFEVELESERLCLRIPGPGSEAIVDRRREETNARAAAAIHITPEILHFSNDGTMLTRFVDAAPLTLERLTESPGALERAAKALRTLHDSAAGFAGVFRVFETIETYIELLAERGTTLRAWQDSPLRNVEMIRAALAARPPQLRPCHCDPTGPNLLDTGERVWLIDWEYAAMNDPMWDLAYFSEEVGLGASAERALLAAYFQRPPHDREMARLAATKVACELLTATWALVQEAEGNRTADFRACAEQAFERAASRVAAADFAGQLEALSRD